MPETVRLRETTAASLSEAAVDDSGQVLLRVIGPGWSENGRYYPEETLRRDGPTVFTEGLHTYVDHPSASEEHDRPERSVRDLAGSLAETVQWRDDGPEGPGLYARASLRDAYRPLVDELADSIGVSIRGDGLGEHGEAEGRQGTIITALTSAESIDYVTRPAAGGRVVQLIESVREATRPVPLAEARNAAQWLESHIHLDFTRMADSLAMDGHLTREERIALSGAIGEGLTAFNAAVEREAPQLAQRDPFDLPDPTPTTTTESTTGDQGGNAMPPENTTGGQTVADLTEAQTRITALEARNAELEADAQRRADADRLAEAQAAVTRAVADVDVPEPYAEVAESLRERAASRVTVTRDADGAIVTDALAEAARREVGAEVEALTRLAEAAGIGRVLGAGDGGTPSPGPGDSTTTTDTGLTTLDESLDGVFGAITEG